MDTASLRDLGLWVDLVSGAIFMVAAIFVAGKRPRTRAGFWFGVFAGSIAVRTLGDNGVRLGFFGPITKFSEPHLAFLFLTAIPILIGLGMLLKYTSNTKPYDRWAWLAAGLFVVATSIIAGLAGETFWLMLAKSTAALFSIALFVVVIRYAEGEHKWLAIPFTPYATIYGLTGMSSAFGDPSMSFWQWALWAMDWGAPALAMLLAVVVLGRAGRKRAVLLLVACAVLSLTWTAAFGPGANDSGIIGLSRIVAILAVGYALITHRVFGIDIRLRFTIRQSTLALIFISAFAGVQNLVGEFVTDEAGLISGALASGVLVALIAPLQSLTQAVADRAMPDAIPLEERALETRKGMYARLSEAAWSDGAITRKEVQILETARINLGLDTESAMEIEIAARSRG